MIGLISVKLAATGFLLMAVGGTLGGCSDYDSLADKICTLLVVGGAALMLVGLLGAIWGWGL